MYTTNKKKKRPCKYIYILIWYMFFICCFYIRVLTLLQKRLMTISRNSDNIILCMCTLCYCFVLLRVLTRSSRTHRKGTARLHVQPIQSKQILVGLLNFLNTFSIVWLYPVMTYNMLFQERYYELATELMYVVLYMTFTAKR